MPIQVTTADNTPARDATVRERPILFSGPMVRAIRDGSKSQTRRVVKGEWARDLKACSVPTTLVQLPARQRQAACDCPHGQPGDRLWVRETWSAPDACECSETCHTPGHVFYHADDDGYQNAQFNRKRPSIFMPRWASRLTLELTDVRVERLQQITENDAKAEGITDSFPEHECNGARPFVDGYRWLWDSLNAKRGYGWSVNPWVWVLSFRRVDA